MAEKGSDLPLPSFSADRYFVVSAKVLILNNLHILFCLINVRLEFITPPTKCSCMRIYNLPRLIQPGNEAKHKTSAGKILQCSSFFSFISFLLLYIAYNDYFSLFSLLICLYEYLIYICVCVYYFSSFYCVLEAMYL